LEIVSIYNAAIPSRTATAETEPVTVVAREPWFGELDQARRPLSMLTDSHPAAGRAARRRC